MTENLAVLFPRPDTSLSPARAALADRLAEDAEARAALPRIRAALRKLGDVGANYTRLLRAANSQTANQIDALAAWAMDSGSEPEPFRLTGADRNKLDIAEAEASVAQQARARLEADLAKSERRVEQIEAQVEAALLAVAVEEVQCEADRLEQARNQLRCDGSRLRALIGSLDSMAAKVISAGAGPGSLADVKRLSMKAENIVEPQRVYFPQQAEFAVARQELDDFTARLRADLSVKL